MTLKLKRGENEELVINDVIRLTFVEFKRSGHCSILVDAPPENTVWRGEVHARIEAERKAD